MMVDDSQISQKAQMVSDKFSRVSFHEGCESFLMEKGLAFIDFWNINQWWEFKMLISWWNWIKDVSVDQEMDQRSTIHEGMDQRFNQGPIIHEVSKTSLNFRKYVRDISCGGKNLNLKRNIPWEYSLNDWRIEGIII